jgi:lysophospholipase L1-like esterase
MWNLNNLKVKIKLFLTLAVLFSTFGCMVQQTTIYTIGDSTMANKPNPEENPERGWAQVLPQFFEENVVIDNRAVNGRSTRSFITEKRWDSVMKTLKKDDYVFIQFGHNDQKETDPNRYSNLHTEII